jgi:hypothetical protein
MTPKEKARELRDKMYLKIPAKYDPTLLPKYPIAKQCALIAVDEILQHNAFVSTGIKPSVYDYWQEVKTEINKL